MELLDLNNIETIKQIAGWNNDRLIDECNKYHSEWEKENSRMYDAGISNPCDEKTPLKELLNFLLNLVGERKIQLQSECDCLKEFYPIRTYDRRGINNRLDLYCICRKITLMSFIGQLPEEAGKAAEKIIKKFEADEFFQIELWNRELEDPEFRERSQILTKYAMGV